MKGGCCGLYCIEIKGNENGRFTISGLVLIEIRYDRMSLAKKTQYKCLSYDIILCFSHLLSEKNEYVN